MFELILLSSILMIWMMAGMPLPKGNSGNMGGSKQQTIQDPAAAYKNWANTTKQEQFNQQAPERQVLGNYFTSNFGGGGLDQISSANPLYGDVYKALQGDVEGKGGPFTSLKNNLLGSFDTQAGKSTEALKNQLVKEGIYSSGQGIGVQSDLASQLAQQRGLVSSQADVELLNMANQIAQQQINNQQLLGFTNPLQTLQQQYTMSNPYEAQNIQMPTIIPGQSSPWGSLLGTVAGGALGSFLGPMGTSVGASLGKSLAGGGG